MRKQHLFAISNTQRMNKKIHPQRYNLVSSIGSDSFIFAFSLFSHYFNRLEHDINMKSFVDLKANARSALLGRYSVLIGAGILAWLIAALIEIPFSRMLQEGFYYIHIFRIIWAYVGMLFVGLIGLLFNIGITHMHMESARDIRPQFSDLLYPFRNRPDKFIGCELILILISFVCTLPGAAVTAIAALRSGTLTSLVLSSQLITGLILLVIGFVVQLILGRLFSQVSYLLLDHPDYRVLEALHESFSPDERS